MESQVTMGAPPDVCRQGLEPPNQRIKSPLLSSIILLEMLSSNASMCRELLFCPVACVRAVLRMPNNAGAYRGIRATMEQPWVRDGLDHYGRGVRLTAGEKL